MDSDSSKSVIDHFLLVNGRQNLVNGLECVGKWLENNLLRDRIGAFAAYNFTAITVTSSSRTEFPVNSLYNSVMSSTISRAG